MDTKPVFSSRWTGAGGLALAVLCAGWFWRPDRFFQAYFFGYLFWLSVSLGALSILLLHHATGGAWGFVIRRNLEAAVRVLPVFFLLLLPVVLGGLDDLYAWARPETVAHDEILQHKQPYLNPAFFAIRALLYFGLWMGLGLSAARWSRRQDTAAAPDLDGRRPGLGSVGLVVYALAVTFASFDWLMSLDAHWFSTMFGVRFAAGLALGGISFAILLLARSVHTGRLREVARPDHFHDLGKLLLAFVMFWTYIVFSEFLIIWSGNLAEETPWYIHRFHGGWQWVGIGLMLFHFLLPFALLLSRERKRDLVRLQRVAALVFVMRLADLAWLMLPAFSPGHFRFGIWEALAVIGLGGIWLRVFARRFAEAPNVPAHLPDYMQPAGPEEAEHA
jgi:hypothetical protein